MPLVRAHSGVITQINVFTVPAGGQEALIEFLGKAAEVASEVPGWLSASLHRRLDGTRVINYAQSQNMDAATRVFRHLNAKGLIEANRQYGEAHPGLYEVVFTLEA